ncbi:MAG: hypothetical protein AAB438_00995 [Patescibacteria group bacterium]
MKHCKDCEPAQQSHFFAYYSVVLGILNEPFLNFMESIFGHVAERISQTLGTNFIKLMVFLRLGHYTNEISPKNSLRARCVWEEANKRGIKMREFHMGPVSDVFIAEFKGKTISFDSMPMPDTISPSLKWMDDKWIMKKKFKKENIPVANGGVAWNKKSALKIFNKLSKPVIAKPNLGSRSRHTTIHINTVEELMVGYTKAKMLSPFVVIEEELKGVLFRGTVIGGKLVGVVKREWPQVEGDGIHTLKELLEKENERPERNGPVFHKIALDKEAFEELKRQNIKMEDIPEAGRIVTFSQKTSRGVGGQTTEVTETTNEHNKKMLEHVASFLKNEVVGVDFIMEDITKPWFDQPRSGVIECNSLPFIDLHQYVLFGTPNNVAAKLWDLVLPESKPI